MRGVFIIIVQFLIFQNVLSIEITKISEDTEIFRKHNGQDATIGNFMVAEYKEERSISDIWDNIKNSAKNAWNFLKSLAKSTKEKIKIWAGNVKERALNIAKSFEERLRVLVSKITDVLQSILNDEDIKKCFQDEAIKINTILINIINDVTTCISNQVSGVSTLEDFKTIDAMLNDSKFLEEIDAKLNMCKQNNEQIEDCFQKVREDILRETEEIEEKVLRSRIQSRGFADDILDAVVTCSTDGLVKASAAVTNIILSIIKCIAQLHI